MMTVTTIRAVLPEFTDVKKYSDAGLQFWLDTAAGRLDAGIWGAQLDEGLMYLAAHLAKLAHLASVPGGNAAGAVVSSKSVGPASVSYDNNLGNIQAAGSYNLTVYGKLFYNLIRMVGSSGVQLNPSGAFGPGAVGFPYSGRVVM